MKERLVDPPVLLAYESEGNYCIWCEHCYKWHRHGTCDGSRVAHCHDYISRETGRYSFYYTDSYGYDIRYAGEMTDEIERNHGMIPADIAPLSPEQLRIWEVVYGRIESHPAKPPYPAKPMYLTAARLLHLFTLNNLASGIVGDHPLAKQTYLTWQLERTEELCRRPRVTPWRYAFTDTKKTAILQAVELMKARFPDDTRPALTWMQERVEDRPGALLPVWWAWDDFTVWQSQKAPAYKMTRLDWKYQLSHESAMNPTRVKGEFGEMFQGFALKGQEDYWMKKGQ